MKRCAGAGGPCLRHAPATIEPGRLDDGGKVAAERDGVVAITLEHSFVEGDFVSSASCICLFDRRPKSAIAGRGKAATADRQVRFVGGADISWIVGLVVPGAVYLWLSRAGNRRADTRDDAGSPAGSP